MRGDIDSDSRLELSDRLEISVHLHSIAPERPSATSWISLVLRNNEEQDSPCSDTEPRKRSIVKCRSEIEFDRSLDLTALEDTESERQQSHPKLSSQLMSAAEVESARFQENNEELTTKIRSPDKIA